GLVEQGRLQRRCHNSGAPRWASTIHTGETVGVGSLNTLVPPHRRWLSTASDPPRTGKQAMGETAQIRLFMRGGARSCFVRAQQRCRITRADRDQPTIPRARSKAVILLSAAWVTPIGWAALTCAPRRNQKGIEGSKVWHVDVLSGDVTQIAKPVTARA